MVSLLARGFAQMGSRPSAAGKGGSSYPAGTPFPNAAGAGSGGAKAPHYAHVLACRAGPRTPFTLASPLYAIAGQPAPHCPRGGRRPAKKEKARCRAGRPLGPPSGPGGILLPEGVALGLSLDSSPPPGPEGGPWVFSASRPGPLLGGPRGPTHGPEIMWAASHEATQGHGGRAQDCLGMRR